MRTFVALCAVVLSSVAAGQSVPGNLEVESIPPFSDQLREGLRPYLEYREARFIGWSAGPPRALIATRFAATPQLHLVQMPGGARTQLTFFDDSINEAQFRPHDPNTVIFSKDTGGDENYQIYRLDLRTRATALLTDGKSRSTNLVLSRSGRWLAYASNRRNGDDMDIWLDDLTDDAGPRLLVQMTGGGWTPTDFSHDEAQLALYNEISANQSEIAVASVKDGPKRLVTKAGSKVSYLNPRFSGLDADLYMTSDEGNEYQRLVRVHLADGTANVVNTEPWDVESFAVSGDGKRIAYVTNENGISTLHVIDASGHAVVVPPMPKGLITDLQWHPDGHVIGFDLETARAPLDVYSVDVEVHALTRWTESETGGLNAAQNAEPELVTLKSFDGTTISAFVYRPDAARHPGKRPVVLIIHGGPEDQSRPWFQNRLNYWINELGIALVYPNVRGSLGYGKTFLALDNKMKREDTIRDIGAILDWIGADPRLDAGRIGVYGPSYGGYMTLATMTHYNDRIRAAIEAVGISNFVTFLENTSGYRKDLRRVEYGDERIPAEREFLTRVSPLTSASKISKPLLVVAGDKDPRVPASEGRQIVKAVRANGGPVWWLLAKDEGHGFVKKPNRDFQTLAMTEFWQEFLLK